MSLFMLARGTNKGLGPSCCFSGLFTGITSAFEEEGEAQRLGDCGFGQQGLFEGRGLGEHGLGLEQGFGFGQDGLGAGQEGFFGEQGSGFGRQGFRLGQEGFRSGREGFRLRQEGFRDFRLLQCGFDFLQLGFRTGLDRQPRERRRGQRGLDGHRGGRRVFFLQGCGQASSRASLYFPPSPVTYPRCIPRFMVTKTFLIFREESRCLAMFKIFFMEAPLFSTISPIASKTSISEVFAIATRILQLKI